MKIIGKSEDINYEETKDFFERRAKKFRDSNPYAVTMYQDDNPELVKERNLKETEKLKSFLKLDEESTVLDIACGIGRWSDAITENIKEYCGIDFCDDFIKIAQKRNADKNNRYFYTAKSTELERILEEKERGKYNRILLIGSLMYLNDEDLTETINMIINRCSPKAIICIREPIGLEKRLTLVNQFSKELVDNYNAIYRSKEELLQFFERFFTEGFEMVQEGFMFDDRLNNRKETTQYYFILER